MQSPILGKTQGGLNHRFESEVKRVKNCKNSKQTGSREFGTWFFWKAFFTNCGFQKLKDWSVKRLKCWKHANRDIVTAIK